MSEDAVLEQAPVNLQREWDRCLIQKFYNASTLKMYIVSAIFKKDFGITDEQFYKLKRIPTHPGHRNVYARRFICAYLPKIADILWRHKIEELDTLATAMSKINYDAIKFEIDYDKASKDRHSVAYSKKKNRQAELSLKHSKEWHKGINHNNLWGVTK